MARVKRGTTVKQKHKKILDRAKGYLARHHSTYRAAREKTEKAGQYAYRDRRQKKRDFRSLWIVRINAAVRPNGLTYSQFMNGLKISFTTPMYSVGVNNTFYFIIIY